MYTSSDFLLFWFLLFMYLCTFFFWISVNKQNLNLNLMLKYCHTFHDRILTLNFLDILARSSLADEGYRQMHTNSCSRTSRKTRRGTNVWRSFLQIQHSCRISHETLRSLFSEWRLDPGEWGKSPLPSLIFDHKIPSATQAKFLPMFNFSWTWKQSFSRGNSQRKETSVMAWKI